ncbi:FHA domain-containing protein [Hathewaya proteolytica DSM 3090]|uniref:FHA domain-containing protein n=1 Tax=Hathewaya proteolytica DSM 3090 TaxID=1121331 RepID=A0A1M6NFR9_9CLOT|nr:FHA domain-containing protein [Hathewaya proteolytica]SHJ94608.1 FHA domain-containing protein [Hathewaya proteolytica DSM 3090]
MDWSFLSSVFKYIIIILLYVIIIVALGIMYRDIKKPKKYRKSTSKKFALEVIKADKSKELPKGAIVPILDEVNVGRKQDNNLVLDDEFVSSYHSKLYTRQGNLIIQDLNSTNGTYVNNQHIKGEAIVKTGDVIKIGNTLFKVIS